MSTDYHTPHPFGAPLTSDELNAPLGELDAAIGGALSAIGASALAITTTDAVATAGQKVVPVTATTGFVVGQPVWIGDVAGTFEVGVIASIQAGVSLTMVGNLAGTYASGKIVSSSPAELATARGGQASLDARLDLYDLIKTEVETARGGEASLTARLAAERGAAFPAQPAYGNNRPFYRTDRRVEYFYDGTRWLTTQLYDQALNAAVALPFSATQTGGHRMTMPGAGAYSIWLESIYASVFIAAGGTALAAGHNWAFQAKGQPSGANLGTGHSINSGASAVWRQFSPLAINTVVATTEFEIEVVSTKTGTPGDAYYLPRLTYRLIG